MPAFGSWTPLHSAHAIELAAISIGFSEPVGDVTWRKAQAHITPSAEELGLTDLSPIGLALPQELQGLGLKFPLQQGIAYVRKDSDGNVSERCQIARDTLRFEDFAYIRWIPFRERAKRLLSDIARTYSEVSSLATIQTEYNDVFVSNISNESADTSEVIDVNSPHVSRAAVQRFDSWHCHTGWFEREDPSYRRLININIDVADRIDPTGPTRTVRVRTLVTDQFGETANLATDDQPLEWTRLERHLESAHAKLKSILRTVLTDDATRAIALT